MTGQEVYSILVARGVTRLYHANSVKTSLSQLRLGGLASRQAVEQAGLPQTKQITDEGDQKFGIWGDVFVDMVDIHARISDRNKYGPVQFTLNVEVLTSLPENARVLVTRSNPSKWADVNCDEQRYFLNAVALAGGLTIGNLDQMLVIRTDNGFVPFGCYLQTIVLDEPRLAAGESPEFQAAAKALANAATASSFPVDVVRRSCSPCKCLTSYTEPKSRIPWFYSVA